MPIDEDYSDSDEYNIMNNIPTPLAFTYLEDNIVELMGGPVETYNFTRESSSDEEVVEENNENITLNNALKGYDYENSGKELVFSINKHFSKKQKKRKDIKKEKKPVYINEGVERILSRLGACRTDFNHEISYEPVEEKVKKEKKVCGNWEAVTTKRKRKNGPKFIKRK